VYVVTIYTVVENKIFVLEVLNRMRIARTEQYVWVHCTESRRNRCVKMYTVFSRSSRCCWFSNRFCTSSPSKDNNVQRLVPLTPFYSILRFPVSNWTWMYFQTRYQITYCYTREFVFFPKRYFPNMICKRLDLHFSFGAKVNWLDSKLISGDSFH
jgi:hypothetical protein